MPFTLTAIGLERSLSYFCLKNQDKYNRTVTETSHEEFENCYFTQNYANGVQYDLGYNPVLMQQKLTILPMTSSSP